MAIIRLAVTVGILAAVYLFIVKPVLHTTENVSNTVNHSIESADRSVENTLGPGSETARALRRADRQVRVQISRSFHEAKRVAGGRPMRMLHCIQTAGGNVERMQKCATRFAP